MSVRSLTLGSAAAALLAATGAVSAQTKILDSEASASSGSELFGVTASGSFGISGASLSGGGAGVATAMAGDADVATTATTGTTSTTSN